MAVFFINQSKSKSEKKIDLRFEIRTENTNTTTMASIQDIIDSKKNKVCSKCKETNFHLNLVIIYEEEDEPYISFGNKIVVWCEFCNDQVDLIERPKEEKEEGVNVIHQDGRYKTEEEIMAELEKTE